jgi:hypothetical protein
MPMKWSVFLSLFMAGILISGCASHKQKTSAPVPKGSSLIITPDASLAARVVSYNVTGRFVVLSFPVGQMPGMGQSLFLYHDGLKSGEVKISGPQDDNNHIAADLVTGDAQVGDEVRDQ